jgi:hypothetical protein
MLLVVGLARVASAAHPLGDVVPSSLLADVTTDGFELLDTVAAAELPTRIDVPTFSDAAQSGCILGACAFSYDIELSGMFAEVELTSLEVQADADAQELDVDGSAVGSLNTAAEPANLDIRVELGFIEIIDSPSCDARIQPVDVDISSDIGLALVPNGDGTNSIDTTVSPVTWSWSANGDDVVFTGCVLADVVNTVNDALGFFGLNIYDILIDQLEPQVDSVVDDLPGALEPLLDEALGGIDSTQEIDVLGTAVSVSLWPDDIEIVEPGAGAVGGVRLGFASSIDLEPDPCIERFGVTGSLETPSSAPGIGNATDIAFTPSVESLVNDDFANHFLYALWSAGLLCTEIVDDPSLGLPFPLDTALLELIAPGTFAPLFADPVPLVIRTAPRLPPTIELTGTGEIAVLVDGLGLDMIAEVDGRSSRVLGLETTADVGVSLPYDPATGLLTVDVDADGAVITPSVAYNELDPQASPAIASQLSLLFGLLVQPALEGLVPPFTVVPPSFGVLGVTDLDIRGLMTDGPWLAAFAALAPLPPGTEPTSCAEGCDATSCTSGCATGGVGPIGLLLPLVVAALRRRP